MTMNNPQSQQHDPLHVVYQHHPDIVHRSIAGEVILVPIRNNVGDMECIYTLNETAARLWDLTDGQRTLAQVHAEFLAEYEIDPVESQQDLLEWVQNLVGIGALLEVKE